MTDQPTSGNRWERPEDKPPPSTAGPSAAEQPTAPLGADGEPAQPEPPVRPVLATRGERYRSALSSTRTRVGAAAAAIFLVGGGAGFALAGTTGEHGGDGDVGGPGRGYDHRVGQPGQQPGQLPGQGTPFGQDDQNGEQEDSANGSGT